MQGTGDNNNNIFADLDRRVNVVATIEPTAYINVDSDHSGTCTDPIRFWLDNDCDRFAQMALDFVSVPGTSFVLIEFLTTNNHPL